MVVCTCSLPSFVCDALCLVVLKNQFIDHSVIIHHLVYVESYGACEGERTNFEVVLSKSKLEAIWEFLILYLLLNIS